MTDSNTPGINTWDRVCDFLNMFWFCFKVFISWTPALLAIGVNCMAFLDSVDNFSMSLLLYVIFFTAFPYLVYFFRFWFPFNLKKDIVSAIIEDVSLAWKLLLFYIVEIVGFLINTIVFNTIPKIHTAFVALSMISIILFVVSFWWIYKLDKFIREYFAQTVPSITSSVNIVQNNDSSENKDNQSNQNTNNPT